MRIAIVDDEPLARARLRGLLQALGLGEIVGEAASGLEALALVSSTDADVVLLDIRLPGMDGLEVASHLARLARPPAVIFTTAFDQHALAAFDANALAYLLKPIRLERLQAALTRAGTWTAAQALAAGDARQPVGMRTHFSALVAGNLRLVPLADVRYLQATQGYVAVVHPGGELVIEDSLRALEDEFGEIFLRIHRHTLVALAHVAALERDRLGNAYIRLREVAVRLPVSRRLLPEVRRRLR